MRLGFSRACSDRARCGERHRDPLGNDSGQREQRATQALTYYQDVGHNSVVLATEHASGPRGAHSFPIIGRRDYASVPGNKGAAAPRFRSPKTLPAGIAHCSCERMEFVKRSQSRTRGSGADVGVRPTASFVTDRTHRCGML
jgi:hypothetical protein